MECRPCFRFRIEVPGARDRETRLADNSIAFPIFMRGAKTLFLVKVTLVWLSKFESADRHGRFVRMRAG